MKMSHWRESVGGFFGFFSFSVFFSFVLRRQLECYGFIIFTLIS